MSQQDAALDAALGKALRAVKSVAEEGEEAPEKAELRDLLLESRGTLKENGEDKPYYRYAYSAADLLFSDPDRYTKAEGVTYADLVNVVTTLLERQVRLDTSSGAAISEAWSAQTLLDRVLERSGKGQTPQRLAFIDAV